ncbi:RHS repeat-associated core domain-containing protein [Corallococcus sp. 4LFB]|uniref:RHS repeat-associated core domain-containing protein n=1 Tax=Corallococcus sp. 4LFB TaxID=3383249 RepID=UPI003975B1A3
MSEFREGSNVEASGNSNVDAGTVMKKRWGSRAARGLMAGGIVLVGLGVAWAAETLNEAEVQQRVDQAPLSPAPPLGGPSSAGVSAAAPVPVGSLRPTYSETDFSLSSAIGDFAFTRTFTASTQANTLGIPEKRMLTPFGRVMGSSGTNSAYRWTHNLYSYVLTGVDRVKDPSGTDVFETPFCTVVAPSGGTLRFNYCGMDQQGAFATSMHDQHVKLRWDSGGFTLISPEGRFRYTQAVLVGGLTQPALPHTRWNDAYFLTAIEPTSYGTSTAVGNPGRRLIASLQYHTAMPAGCTAPSTTYGKPTEMVQYANLANGSRLAFSYASLPTQDTTLAFTHECVLSKVDLEEGTSGTGLGTRNVVTYDYAMHDLNGQIVSSPAGMLGGARYFVGASQNVPAGAEAPVPMQMTYTWADQGTAVGTVRWKVFRDGVLVTSKLLHRQMHYVLEDENAWTKQTVTAEVHGMGAWCGPGKLSGNCANAQKQSFIESVSAGDGFQQSQTSLVRAFVASNSWTHAVTTTGAEIKCGSDGVNNDSHCKGVGISLTPQHTRSWADEYLSAVEPAERWTGMAKSQSDARGSYSAYTNEIATNGNSSRSQLPYDVYGSFLPPAEMRRADFGAVDATGNGALLTKSYTYEYGRAGTYPGYEQQLKSETGTSAMASRAGAGAQATWTYQYEPTTNQLMAKVRSGYTWDFTTSFGAPTLKHLATFYRTYRLCKGETPADADPQARTVEIEGPCWVSSPTATTCSGPAPVTHYFYGASGASNGQQQHLIRKRVFTQFVSAPQCNTAPYLDTTYDAYDDQGRLLQTTAPAGVQTQYAYASGKLVRKTVKAALLADLVTDYGYGNGLHGDYIRHPDGRYEVQCYRTGTGSAGCTGGTLTDKLQWKATSASASGANYSERVNYFYRSGRLIKEETLAAGGVLRARRTYDSDPLGRPTFQGFGEEWGEGASWNSTYSSTKLFDAENNPIREGLPYLANYGRPPAFCGGFNTTSGALTALPPECRAFEYDRLNRLVSMLEAAGPAGGQAATATHIAYDEAGNVRSIKQGCAAGTTLNSCANQPAIEYLHDDFGNLLEVKAPWGAAATPGQTPSAGPSVIQFAYDTLGSPIVKQTSSMAQTASWTAYQYDAIGRPLWADARQGTQSERLYQYWYAGQVPGVPTNCPVAFPGQQHVMVDSFGATWFEYDAMGRVSAKYRVRGAQAQPPSQGCNTSPYFSGKDSPNHFFFYDSAGRLVSEIYPYGRAIEYRYYAANTGMPHRVSDIYVAHLYPNGASGHDPLITAVEWEPYGGLKAYRVHSRGESEVPVSAQVRYHQGGSNTGVADCSAASFSQAVDSVGVPFGRLSGLSVTRVALGDVFKRTYRYRADQLLDEDTCILQTSSTVKPSTQYYGSESGASGFDARLQLRNVTSWPSDSPWADNSISYSYDARGNRTSETWNGSSVQSEYTSAFPRVDQIVTRKHSAPACPAGQVGCLPYSITTRYLHDMAGRMSNASWYLSQTAPQPYYALTLNATTTSPVDLGAVYRQVTSTQLGGSGVNYEYFYDAAGRRRLKRSWDGREDEYFYSGTQLLVDVGHVASSPSTTDYVLDEYVWLDGRPVALIKSRFTHSPFLRVADNTADCSRFGLESDVPCGTYFPVTDGLGKPVLLLDSKGRISGTGDYEPFGHVNRVAQYAAAQDAIPSMATLRVPSNPALVTQARARFEWVSASGQEGVYLSDSQSTPLQGANSTDGQLVAVTMGKALTPGWVNTPADGYFYVVMGLDNDAQTHVTAHLGGFEYRRFEPTTKPVWLPLRLPGQYYDPETDLFENWNRYYDAALGRYLAPEGLLSEPAMAIATVVSGSPLLTYSYAANNPVANSDPTGLIAEGVAGEEALLDCLADERMCSQENIDENAAAYRQNSIDALQMLATLTAGALIQVPTAVAVAADILLNPAETDASDGSVRTTPPTLPEGTIVNQDGVKITHNYGADAASHGGPMEHGPAHAHVTGSGTETRIGPQGFPLKGDPKMTKAQQAVYNANKNVVRSSLNKIGRWLDFKKFKR